MIFLTFSPEIAAGAWKFLNSNFWTSLAGAGAGAVAGAWAAERIASQNGQTKRQIEELRGTNAAIAIAITTLNAFGALKRQHIAPMIETYKVDRKRVLATVDEAEVKKQKTTVKIEVDFKFLPPPHTPINVLEDLIFKKIDATTGILSLFTYVSQAEQRLSQNIVQRNALIEDLRVNPRRSQEMVAEAYFGIPTAEGLDTRYADIIEGLELYTDDCMAFTHALVEDLLSHAEAAAELCGSKGPKAARCDLAPIADLLPRSQHYSELVSKIRGTGP